MGQVSEVAPELALWEPSGLGLRLLALGRVLTLLVSRQLFQGESNGTFLLNLYTLHHQEKPLVS